MTSRITSYPEAIDWVFGLINFERKPGRSRDFRLDRTRQLLAAVGDPHKRVPAVHIAGTKGKGSTASMVAAMLSQAGLVTGLFTSPHITRFEERLTVDAEEATEAEMLALVQELQAGVAKCDGLMPTYFEAAMVLAWCFYRMRKVDIAVLEVGLGGRLDATNVCCPEVCAITSISLDHTSLLGDSLDKIAAEKAGIIKRGVPVVSGVTNEPARSVIRERAADRGSQLYEVGDAITLHYRPPVPGAHAGTASVTTHSRTRTDIKLPLPGQHQAHNCAIAIAVIDVLCERGWRIPPDAVESGLVRMSLPARVEVMGSDPVVVVDAAHNEASIAALVETLDEISVARPRVAIFATTRQKDVAGMLGHILRRFDQVVLTEYVNNPRAVPVAELQETAHEIGCGNRTIHVAEEPHAAWSLATRIYDAPAMVCVTGSFFIAAELREIILGEQKKPTR